MYLPTLRHTSRFSLSVPFLALLLLVLPTIPAKAGTYTESAHGDSQAGVFRPIIGNAPPSGFGYARGNCTHCHEQHASISGTEPAPVTGPAFFTLFAPNFDRSTQTHPYTEADNFCFFCHSGNGSAQVVHNNDYSQNFGCASQGPTSIMNQMNGFSYHNLYDIYTMADNTFTWFKPDSNPCNACHNPHLAKRNWTAPTDPAVSAISRPSDHLSLWGITAGETMGGAYNTAYEPPFCASNLTNREPAASPTADAGRAATINSVGFCGECHAPTISLYSTPLGRNLQPLDWGGSSGDKHGLAGDTPGITIKEPYSATRTYVLACLDCHEPHGSSNAMLVRRRINGQEMESGFNDLDSNQWGYVCKRCHMDDEDAVNADLPRSSFVSANLNSWRYVHHFAEDAPFGGPRSRCSPCHTPGPPGPISCGTTDISLSACHGHGKIF